jgi:hypothetical protein
MKKTIISMALLVLIGAPGAVAQSGKGTSVGTTINGAVPQAPVGHRQPRASDVPNETSDVPNEKNPPSDPVSKEDAMLNKKMKSICRGC